MSVNFDTSLYKIIMRHFIIGPLLLATILVMSMDIASSYNLPPPNRSTQSFSRRDALERLGGIPFVGAAALVVSAPTAAQAAEDTKEKPETEEEKKARIMKEKIAASKTSYRKPDGESKSPFRLVKKWWGVIFVGSWKLLEWRTKSPFFRSRSHVIYSMAIGLHMETEGCTRRLLFRWIFQIFYQVICETI